MTKIEALRALLAKVETGAFTPNPREAIMPHYREFKALADIALPEDVLLAHDAYGGSLDAAMALHESALPRWNVTCLDQACNLAGHPWGCEVAYFDGSNPDNNRKAYSRHDYPDPARAWLLAILRALIAQEEEG